jgi:hypothetical protein
MHEISLAELPFISGKKIKDNPNIHPYEKELI